MKTYSELIQLSTFEERLAYLSFKSVIGHETFGGSRWLNQTFYRSPEWKHFRRNVILRDNGCDLGIDGFTIYNGIYIHHIEPITPQDIQARNLEKLLNMENVICCCLNTHNLIHYGDILNAVIAPIERTPNDTCPWKQ